MIILAVFFGSTTLVEQNLTTGVFIAGASRTVIIFGLTLFTCFHIRRGFENREIDLFLTKPITRSKFVLYYFSGLAFLSFSIIAPLILMMLFFLKIALLWGNQNGFILWGVSLFLESLIVIAFALFASLTINSAIASVLVCFAFYTFSRVFGYFLITIHNPFAAGLTGELGTVYKKVLWLIGMLVPRLDRYANSEWLIYGISSFREFITFSTASLIYVALLLSMAIYDFKHREF
jgi:ABC-type transport system involved in multi-copper enzyme maturation permease subunit